MSLALVAFALVFCLTAAGVFLPILRRPDATVSREEQAAKVLRDKLAQVARDRADGVIGSAEAAAAEAEIGRALIATARGEAEREATQGRRQRGSLSGLAAVLTVVLCAGLGVYWMTGSFEMASQSPAARNAMRTAPDVVAEHDDMQISESIASLRARLEREPDDVEGWHLLARSYAAVGAYREAAEIYPRLIELAPAAVQLRGDYAEALIQANGGAVDAQAGNAFERVLARSPDDPRALYYLALRDAQNGELLKAAQGWASILRNAPPDAPYRPAINEAVDAVIREAGLDADVLDLPEQTDPAAVPGPTEAEVAAASMLPADERLQMIRGMVGRLETRLAADTGDVAGWLRLARSQAVLGEQDEAVSTLERALRANPGDPALQEALSGLRGSTTTR